MIEEKYLRFELAICTMPSKGIVYGRRCNCRAVSHGQPPFLPDRWNRLIGSASKTVFYRFVFTVQEFVIMKASILTAASVLAIVVSACASKDEPTVDQKVRETVDEAMTKLEETRRDFEAEAETSIERMKVYIDSLEQEYGKAKGESKAALRRRLDDLAAVRDTMVIRYEAVRNASDEKDFDRQRVVYVQYRERNRFWEPNFNTTSAPKSSTPAVKLEPNRNR